MKTRVPNVMGKGSWVTPNNYKNCHTYKWNQSISTWLILWSLSYFLLFNQIVLAASNVLRLYIPGLLGIISFTVLGLVTLSYFFRMAIPAPYINLTNALFVVYVLANGVSFAFSSMQTSSLFQIGVFVAYSIIPWTMGFLGAQYGVNVTRNQGAVTLVLIIIVLIIENTLFGKSAFRPGELIGNPLAIASSGAVATLLYAQSTRKPWAIDIDLIIIGSILVLFTGTRRAFLGIIVAIIVHIIAKGSFTMPKKWWRYTILIVIAVVFTLVIIPQWKITTLGRWRYTLNMLYIGTIWEPKRKELASRALEAFTLHPLIGNWDYVTRGDYAHNMYMDILGRTGLAGLVPFAFLSVWIAARAWRLRRTKYHVWMLSYSFAITSGLIASTVFNDPVFWSIAGYVTGATSKKDDENYTIQQ